MVRKWLGGHDSVSTPENPASAKPLAESADGAESQAALDFEAACVKLARDFPAPKPRRRQPNHSPIEDVLPTTLHQPVAPETQKSPAQTPLGSGASDDDILALVASPQYAPGATATRPATDVGKRARRDVEPRQEIESLQQTVSELESQREAEVAGLREILTRAEAEIEGLRQSAAAEAMKANVLRETLTHLELENQAATEVGHEAQHESGAEALRETETLRQSLHHLQAQREAETAVLDAAAQRESAALQEAESLRRALRDIEDQREADIAQFRGALARAEAETAGLRTAAASGAANADDLLENFAQREIDSQTITEDLRQSLFESESKRKAEAEASLEILARHESDVAELRAAAQRESDTRRESENLRQTLHHIQLERESEVAEVGEILAKREAEAQALRRAVAQQAAEATELRESLIRRETESRDEIDRLRQTLLESEALREAEAASFLEIIAQSQADTRL